ncbi:MAG: hypothetical protein A2W90_15540 [Bacteroidetes bacterium GWF2_42_66]|nr:MAG: hypothetical protein A2W92_08070 [Bacteroidetes bacterium GWA2_42_15]OFY02674.1 MAG: hypothetical protein A2W89_04125 [Bacteroidetes bacterium GWE2_42_39]OFY43873.1 MAG: hypothetical protein A2W90_15540 [Bacteroidetes bacterium GWF2_42_66]HBL77240.1 hypothetical protein [Prolixibacteraceae bacterium]HCR90616.1 hypothetical protein [Prolixibacteraceae bacterium]
MEQTQVNIAVKKIKDIEFFINEEFELANPPIANIGFELTTNINLNDKSVEMLLTTTFVDPTNGNVLMKIKTSNVFLFLELANFHKPDRNEFDIPDNVLVTFLSLSISHSRALLAKNALGTKFADLYIPIVNPSEILKQLFSKQ